MLLRLLVPDGGSFPVAEFTAQRQAVRELRPPVQSFRRNRTQLNAAHGSASSIS